jgi:predicted GNAT family acetyltransferase
MNIQTITSPAHDATLLSQSAHNVNQEICAEALTERNRDEILEFLSARPLHAVIMAGWILDHGVVSPAHRGIFYGYRDGVGQLQGVALIGRNTLFEVRNEEAMAVLAAQAESCKEVRMIMAESDLLMKFWSYFKEPKRVPRKYSDHLFYHIEQTSNATEPTERIRRATLDDIDLVVAAHAEMVTHETGINPLEIEPAGFRDRCAARLNRGRVWICREEDELIFKVDVLTEVPRISYIEGVWVNRAYRGWGICRQALNSLHQKLFADGQTVCLFAEAGNQRARNLYLEAGYQPKSVYSKIYL